MEAYCAHHESATGPVMLVLHPMTLSEECPFCWFERPENADHNCNDRCYCRLVRAALADGSVWRSTARGGAV